MDKMISTRQKTILIISEAYPSDKTPYALAFIHTRVKQYQREGYRVNILSFRAQENYEFDGVSVFSEKNFVKSGQLAQMDCVVSHAPNLRNHFRFILKFRRQITKLVFVFHGHEILTVSKEYPKPYAWNKPAQKQRILQRLYDPFKLLLVAILLKFLMRRLDLKFIFVSKWLRQKFFDNIFVCDAKTAIVINNPISAHFSTSKYVKPSGKLQLSAICLRKIDLSTYAVDLVLKLAQQNPELKIDIFGQGQMPKFVEFGQNVSFHDRFFPQADIPSLLNQYDLAIMPTRHDTQGVSNCEFAKYRIPLITSDIPVMKEMLSGFSNVLFLPNADFNVQVDDKLIDRLKSVPTKNTLARYDLGTTARAELAFFDI